MKAPFFHIQLDLNWKVSIEHIPMKFCQSPLAKTALDKVTTKLIYLLINPVHYS